ARAGRPAGACALLAVVKQADNATVAAAHAAGLRAFAENRVQPLAARPAALRALGRWHLIGPLQGNKVGKAVALIDEFHALDRAELLQPLRRALTGRERPLRTWLQVNVAAEPQKHGVAPDQAAALAAAAAALPGLELAGLMTMAPLVADPEQARPTFDRLRDLAAALLRSGALPDGATGLSMGMSADFEVAAEAGATVVRIGSALFRDDGPC
ncbi:MAG: YggS family pyridoxal phosphate-dependent enzyme, partial [Planctomycetes bacterium]|nr:YggS family pyridoxal phosphate-dependent enzyme [Planctomycetota bacterium]